MRSTIDHNVAESGNALHRPTVCVVCLCAGSTRYVASNMTAAGRTAKGSAVERVLDILDAVGRAERPLSAAELAEQLDIPKASLHRLCAALEGHGYLQNRLNGRGLLAGHRLRQLALGVLASEPLTSQRRAILKSLAHAIGETCNVAVPDGGDMIYYDREETHWPVRVQLQVGSRVPAAATAGGKMYLSTLPAQHRTRLIESFGLQRYTANTLVNAEDLKAELEITAQRGYAVDNEEYIEGMVALAVPILDHQRRLYATLSFHAPCMRVAFEKLTDYLPQVRAASAQLTKLVNE